MTLYLESSALLSWLLGEPKADRIVSCLNKVRTIATSVLTLIETERGLLRAENRQLLKHAERKRLLGKLKSASKDWIRMEITAEVQERAKKPFPSEPLRTLDAIHLATVMEFLEVFPDLQVLSFDTRILDNLEPLGLLRRP